MSICIDKEIMKTCSSCKVSLDFSCFNKDRSRKDGLQHQCKNCKSFYNNKWHQENSEKAKASQAKWRQENSEKAKATNAKWHQENSEKVKASQAKWRQENSERAKATNAKWHQENSEKVKANKAKWYQENSEKVKASQAKWRQENSEKAKASQAKWSQENHEKCNAKASKRRATKRQATPPWYSKDDHLELIELYAIAKHRSEVTGKPYHVDHIHPLKSDLICGLHIPANWAVLEGSKNISKSNKFESYVWSECSFTNPWEV